MKKVSLPYRRKDRNGWWLRWNELGQRKFKQFNSKSEADHYRHVKYMQLNNDVYTAIDVPFDMAAQEYLLSFDVKGLAKSSKHIAGRVLDRFVEFCRPRTTRAVNQKLCDFYILKRQQDDVSPWSVNRDIRTLKAFVNWLKDNQYNPGNIRFHQLPTAPSKCRALTDTQITALLKAAVNRCWQLRIVLALCTGLRKGDLYGLLAASVDLDEGRITTPEQKTGKLYSAPLPDALIPHLRSYRKTHTGKHFFAAHNSRWLDKQFRLFRPDDSVTIQSLRKTFSTRVESTGISTIMLNHSGASVTRKFYNDMDFIKYVRVNQLPVREWLKQKGQPG